MRRWPRPDWRLSFCEKPTDVLSQVHETHGGGPPARPLLKANAMGAMSQLKDPFGLSGATLAGKYDVQGLIAETEFSVVYRAHHRIWRRPVAIKAFKAPMLTESARQQLLESFVAEGALLMDLSERGAAVCQARDVASVITEDGDWLPYLVLEWLEGEPLDAMLTRERALGGRPRTVAQVMKLLDPVAHALALAHARGIVHRDVKPGNVFILADAAIDGPGCKLIDFGGAKVAGMAGGPWREGIARQLFTPAYAAPEQFPSCPTGQAELGPTGPWTDVFAIALLFVEMVTGRKPREGDTISQLALSAWNADARPTPRTLGANVSDEVEGVLARALALRPPDRYANAGVFWSALVSAARAAHTAATVTLTIPLALSRRRHSSRHRWLVPALALLGAAAGGGLVVLEQLAVAPPSARAAASWSGLLAPATVVQVRPTPSGPGRLGSDDEPLSLTLSRPNDVFVMAARP
jgi:serine/threonine protein kinase